MGLAEDEDQLRALAAVRSIDLTTPIRMKLISLQIGKEVSVNDESPDELLALLLEVNRRLRRYDQALAAGYVFPDTDHPR